jgi:hypothetical protein
MRRFALPVILISLVLSACGSSSSSSSDPGAASAATNATSTTQSSTAAASTSTATSASTTSQSSVAAGPPRCVAADLALSFLGQQGATGHGLLGFSLRNSSAHSCHTFGYPGILFLDKGGAALPTDTMRTTHDFFGSAPEVSLLLAPGQSASFRIGVTHGMTSTAGCTSAYGLQVIPPDDTATLRTTIPGGTYECRTASLSPLRPGSSAYP